MKSKLIKARKRGICIVLLFLILTINLNIFYRNYDEFFKKNIQLPKTSATDKFRIEWRRGRILGKGCYDIALGHYEDIYMVGEDGYYNGYIVKWDKNGDLVWEISDPDARFRCIARDISDYLYCAGYGRNPSNPFDEDIFLLRYDRNGAMLNKRFFNKRENDFAYSVVLDGSNNVYVVGITYNDGQNKDILLVKFNRYGNYIWDRVLNVRDDDIGTGLVVDSSNNVYLCGYHSATSTSNDIIIAKYNPQGTLQWSKTWGVSNRNEEAHDIELDSSGNIYITGYTSDESSALLAKFDNAGNEIWNRKWSAGAEEKGLSLDLDSSGNIYISGSVRTYTSSGTLFLVYGTDGVFQWVWDQGTTNYITGKSISVASSKNVYIGGALLSSYDDYYFYLIKFNPTPIITINTPRSNDLYSVDPPNFNVDITDNDLISKYYKLNKGPSYIFTESTGTIDLDAWNACENGSVSIRFYARDNAGSLFEEVIVRKDVLGPVFEINSPVEYNIFEDIAPDYELLMDVYDYDSIWYTINGSEKKFITSLTGTLDQPLWDSLGDGLLFLRFYMNDSLGNIAFNEIQIFKNYYYPIIVIDEPLNNQLIGNKVPNYSLRISSLSQIDDIWYSLDGGSNYSLSGPSGNLDQAAWDTCGNGTVIIKFYANNTIGKTSSSDVVVRKDVYFPLIEIYTPQQDDLCGIKATEYDIYVSTVNLDLMWYTLNYGTRIYFTELQGKIDQTEWDLFGNETVIITFYANNSYGDLNFKEISVQKNTRTPNITIISPLPNEVYGLSTIDFIVDIVDPTLNTTWYNLNGGLNHTFTGSTGRIDSTAWDACGNGSVSIIFFANNSIGNIGYSDVLVIKDIYYPFIEIYSPTKNQFFGNEAPEFNVSITATALNYTWYTLNNGTETFFNYMAGKIDQLAWDACGNGTVILRFYANNSFGQLNYEQVAIYKDNSTPNIIIIKPLFNEIFREDTIDYEVEITDPKLDEMWYTLNDGEVYLFNQSSGKIDQSAWDACGNGTVSIIFYANNTIGNLAHKEVIVRKDIYFPLISIIKPSPDQYCGLLAPSFNITVKTQALNEMWYTLNGGSKFYIYQFHGNIDQNYWDSIPEGNVIIRFYASNTFDQINFEEVTVHKDTSIPNITVIKPSSNELFGIDNIDFELSIIEPNLDTTWYTLNDGIDYVFIGNTGTINQTAWKMCGNGTVSIKFYANNTVGNIGYAEVIVHRDIYFPFIEIYSPSQDQIIGIIAPKFNISISSYDIDYMWYTLNYGKKIYFTDPEGVIEQSKWDLFGEDAITITFYANNSYGQMNSKGITVEKITSLRERNAYAIIIGISDYPGSSYDLSYCDDDAIAVYNTLINDFNFEPGNIIYLQDSSATKADINNAFNIIASFIKPNDIFFFYYSGHGGGNTEYIGPFYTSINSPHPYPNNYDRIWSIDFPDAAAIRVHFSQIDLEYGFDYLLLGDTDIFDGWYYQAFTGTMSNFWSDWIPLLNDNKIYLRLITDIIFNGWGFHVDRYEVIKYDGTHYLCSYDSIPNNPNNYYLDTLLDSKLDSLNCDEKYVVLDSCNSGGLIPEIQGMGRYMMTACKGGQFCMEEPALNHGIFTYYLLDSLEKANDQNGDGVISLEECYSYVYSKTTTYSGSYGSGYRFHPQQYDGIEDQSVLSTSIGSFSYKFIGNRLYYSFYLYGTGELYTLNITLCSLSPEVSIKTVEIKNLMVSYTGFGFYLDYIELDEDYNVSSFELLCEVQGNELITLKLSYGDFDGDGLTDVFEVLNGLDPFLNDTDSDGLLDGDEINIYHTNPLTNDTDSDGLLDYDEIFIYNTNPLDADTDSDGLSDWDEINIYFTDPLDADSDSDNLSDGDEINIHFTNPLNNDTDSDFLLDGNEVNIYNTNPLSNDTDSDLLSDYEEIIIYNTNPLSNDTDSDLLSDYDEIFIYNTNPLEEDTDSDGLSDYDEVITYNTDPLNADTDSDTMPDGWEVDNSLDPHTNDTALDPDNDLLPNILEYQHDTDPQNPDTDGDGLLDGEEVTTYNTDPNLADTDSDGLLDGEEVNTYNTDPLNNDTDGDGLLDGKEVNTYNTDPLNVDTDFDTMPDKWEVDNMLNPLVNDTALDPDNDLLTNILEYQHETDPQNPDTDGDGWTDGDEVLKYDTDPLDPDSHPTPKSSPAIPGYFISLLIGTIVMISLALIKKRKKLLSYN